MKITGIPLTPDIADQAASTIYGKETLSVGVGSILMFGGTSANVPTGWLLCDGSAISRTDYPDLFIFYSALSFPYGTGNGTTTFNLPNLKGKIPIGVGTNVTSLGSNGGTLNHTHTMGDHTHTQSHTHTMAHVHKMDHIHTINHRHLVGSHSHDMDHIHWIPAHYHSVSGSVGGGNHTHNVFVSAATAAGSSGIRGGTNASGTYSRNTDAAMEWSATTGGSVGSIATRNGNSGFWSSSATNETTSGDVVATYTSSYTGNTTSTVATTATKTGGSSLTDTDSYTTATGGMTTTPSVTSSNPAILTVNFIVKV